MIFLDEIPLNFRGESGAKQFMSVLLPKYETVVSNFQGTVKGGSGQSLVASCSLLKEAEDERGSVTLTIVGAVESALQEDIPDEE